MRTAVSSSAALRIDFARRFILESPPAAEILIVGASRGAADDLARSVARARGATFGLAPVQPDAARRAARGAELSPASGSSPTTALGVQAVAARALFELPTIVAPLLRACRGDAGISERAGAHARGARARDGARPRRCGRCGAGGADLAQLARAIRRTVRRGVGGRSRALLPAATRAAVAGRPVRRLPPAAARRADRRTPPSARLSRRSPRARPTRARRCPTATCATADALAHARSVDDDRSGDADRPRPRAAASVRARPRRRAASPARRGRALLRARRGTRVRRDRAARAARGAARRALRSHGHPRSARRSTTPACSSTRSSAPGCPPTSIAARGGRIRPAARFSRCSRARPKSCRRGASPSTCRSARCRTPSPAAPADAHPASTDEVFGVARRAVADDDGACRGGRRADGAA